MKGINTLINTSFFFFPPLAITHKKIPCPRAAPSNSPCLHSLSLSHSTMPGTSQHRKLQKARGCWHGEAVLRAGHPIRTSTETWERNYSATDPLRELQVSNAVCPKTLLHCVSLLPLKLHKTQEQPESRQKRFWNQHRFTESKLFKVKVYLYSL